MKKVELFTAIVIMFAAFAVAQVPASNHVVLLVEQNHGYSSVIGSTAMPYLNSLASKYGLATHYYANAHPSIGNYFEFTTGQKLTNDETRTPANFPVSADNIVRQLMVAGKTWKSYAEGLPYAGYTGGNSGKYAVRRNPFAYFTDVQNSDTQKMNLVPFSQFAADLANDQLPNFSYVAPDLNNDGNAGTLAQADAWLKKNIEPLLANPEFQKDGLLILTFDESATTDVEHGGGHVATVVIGPKAKLGYKSTTLYQHQSLLRTILTALGATSFPGAATTAPVMSDFFAPSQTTSSSTLPQALSTAGVKITSPSNGAVVSSPVRFIASATSSSSAYPITAMRIYVDNNAVYTTNAANLDTSLALAAGGHSVAIVAWDSSGRSYTSTVSINVGPVTAGSVTITSPANGATVSSPVQFAASAKADTGKSITTMRIYVDNTSVYAVNAASINTSLALSSGAHNIVVQAWDNTGAVYKASRTITVPTQMHSVALSWTASTSANVTGYNVYRGTQASGPFTKLTPPFVNSTSYTDAAVNAGSTYYYVVTAVNSSGQESKYSSPASAKIPTP